MSGTTGDFLDFSAGQVIQEFGFDDDVDFALRSAAESVTGESLEDEDYRGATDGVIAWWRLDDGDTEDLIDYLVDCSAGLADAEATIWLLVPSPNQPLTVPMQDVNEAAEAAGLSVTTTHGVSSGWTAYRVTSGHTL